MEAGELAGQIVEVPSFDGAPLKARRFVPEGEAAGVVLSIHGVQSHSGWYTASCAALTEKGFYVLAPDRRGSGLNGAQRGHVDHYQRWIEDLEEARLFAAGETGIEKVHLVGISWGGKLALAYAARRAEAVRSIALVAPGLAPRVDLTARQKFRVALSLVFGARARFPIPITDGAMFTANPERIRYIDSDPLALRDATARFFVESAKLDRSWRMLAPLITAPAFLMLAGLDRIISNERTRSCFARLASPEKLAITYENAHHTIEFEPDPRLFIADLVRWIKRQNESLPGTQ